MKQYTQWECSVCGTKWGNIKMARLCESSPILKPPPFKVGDTIFCYERYAKPEADVVEKIEVGPGGLLGYCNTEGIITDTDANRYIPMFMGQDGAARKAPQWHTWYVTVKNDHQMSKDSDSYTDVLELDATYLTQDGAKCEPEFDISITQRVNRATYEAWHVYFYTAEGQHDRRLLRYGQAFMNEFLPDLTDSELFYTTKTQDAQRIIYNRYIKEEEQ